MGKLDDAYEIARKRSDRIKTDAERMGLEKANELEATVLKNRSAFIGAKVSVYRSFRDNIHIFDFVFRPKDHGFQDYGNQYTFCIYCYDGKFSSHNCNSQHQSIELGTDAQDTCILFFERLGGRSIYPNTYYDTGQKRLV